MRFEEQRIRAEADRRLREAEPSRSRRGRSPPSGQPPPAPRLAADLSSAEQRLQEDREARERSMAEAEQRLREIDERTKAAEERAAEAKRLEG